LSDAPDLRADPRALRVMKQPVAVNVAFAREAGVCKTLEGDVGFRAGDAILTGSAGENWPIRRQAFLDSYRPDPPAKAGEDGVYRKAPSLTLALRLDHEVDVAVGWQTDLLHGRVGDWLVRYEDESSGVLRDDIFRATYGPAPGETRWPPPV
jgi:PGDYG protein